MIFGSVPVFNGFQHALKFQKTNSEDLISYSLSFLKLFNMNVKRFSLPSKIPVILAFFMLLSLSSCDLTFTEIWNTPANATANTKFMTGCTITNSWKHSNLPSDIYVNFYLSRDEYVSNDDRLLKTEYIQDPIAFLEKKTIITEINLPADLVNGQYFFIFHKYTSLICLCGCCQQ
jgi:hypothetical protein